MMSLKDKIALVTGASSGIGWAVTRLLLAEGVKVVGVARRLELMHELKENLSSCEKPLFFPIRGDLSSLSCIQQDFENVKKEFGLLHILVCNAGFASHSKILDENNEADLQKVIDVNLMGTVNCIKQAYSLMKVALKLDQHCHVVTVNSLLGQRIPQHIVEGGYNLYPVAKHALMATNEILRREFQQDKLLRLSNISPGLTDTGFGSNFDSKLDTTGFGFPLLQPEDVARGILFILQSPPYVNVADMLIVPSGENY